MISRPRVRRLRRPVASALLAVGLVGASLAGPSRPGAPAEPLWAWPVAAPHPIVRPFIAPPTPYSAGHRGIDIRAPDAAEVRAPADGIVHFAGVVVDRPVISVRHAGGVLSSFEPVDPLVATGDRVRRGQVIGTLRPGHCATPCLHLGARVDGGYVNPLLFLGGLEHAVLYPLG